MRSAAGRAAEGLIDSRALPGVSRLALGAGVTVLFAILAEPANAQFGFSWFGMQPAPVMRTAPMEPFVRRVRPRPGPSLGTLKSAIKAQAKRETVQKPIVGPVMIMVSVNRQRLTVYDGDRPIVSAPVSTGMKGHETPLGVFSVIQKELLHHSNLYSNAPMPYMQRITWSGVALHEGTGVGHPASHGCIRMPREFAVRLWALTRLGARVIIARNELVPAEFNDPHLFVHKDKPAEPVASAAPVQTAHAAVLVTDAAPAPVGVPAPDVAGAPPPSTEPAPAAAPAANSAAPVATADSDAATSAAEPIPPADVRLPPEKPAQLSRAAAARHAPIAIFISRKEGKIFVRQNFAPLFEAPVTIAQPEQPLGTHVMTAMALADDGATFRWNIVSLPPEPPRPARAAKTETADQAGRHRNRRTEAAKVLPEPKAPDAHEVLARIEIPQDTLEQISEMMVPGSSLIISDQGLGPETGKGTDFIVLTR